MSKKEKHISSSNLTQRNEPGEMLGLINKKTRKGVSFRMRIDVNEALDELTATVKSNSKIDIKKIHVIESLILIAVDRVKKGHKLNIDIDD